MRIKAVLTVVSVACVCLLVAACGSSSSSSTAAGDGARPASATARAALKQPGDITIDFALVGVAGDPFFTTMQNGAEQAGRDLGVKVNYRQTSTFDIADQARLINDAVAQKPDGIVVSIADVDALSAPVKAATDAGIPVVVINSGKEVLDKVGGLTFLGEDADQMGFVAGERLKAAGVSKGICINHGAGVAVLTERCNGFKRALGGNSREVTIDGTDPTATKNRVEATLRGDPSINGIFALGPPGAEPAMDAIADMGVGSKVKLATTDLSPKIIQGIQSGAIVAAMDQQQFYYAYEAVNILALYNEYRVHPIGDVATGPFVVDKSNVADVASLAKASIR